MEALKYLLVPVILALLSGCAAKSIVVSKRATGIEEGIVYSLPKQLVKVTYKRNTEDLKEKKVCEELIIKAEEPIPDTDNTFYATIDHWIMSSDALEISTKNGLLDGAVGHSEDETGDIIVSLAGSLAGLGILPFSIPGEMPKLLLPPSEPSEECKKKEATSIVQYIEPDKREDIEVLNRRFCKAGVMLCLRIDKPQRANLPEISSPTNGLIYRQPGTYTFKIKRSNWNNDQKKCVDISADIQVVSLTLSQGGQIGILPFPRGFVSKNEYDVSFSSGRLSRSKIVQPSEVLGTVNIVPNALKAMISVPAELLKLRVDYSSREKELLELRKVTLDAQAEIIKKQAEIERLIKEKNAE